jgi:acyl-CoA hydrolase
VSITRTGLSSPFDTKSTVDGEPVLRFSASTSQMCCKSNFDMVIKANHGGMMQPFQYTPEMADHWSVDKMDTVVAELVSFLQAAKSGSLIGYVILLAVVLIGSASVTVALVYRRTVNERRRTTSKATQENFEAIAADLRKRALEIKEGDNELRKRELEVKECDEPKAFLKDTNAELRSKRERTQQQQALKEQQRILKQSVSHAIMVGLKDNQDHLLQIDLKGLSAVQRKRKKAA